MIENIERLSPNDKLYMLYNKNSFSLPTISSINYKEEEWNIEIKTHISPAIIDKMIKDSVTVTEEALETVTTFEKDVYFQSRVRKILQGIANMPCETKENIRDILAIFGTLLKFIDDNHQIVPSWNGYKFGIIKYFLSVLLPWKLNAHEILVSISTDCIPNDNTLKDFYLKTLRYILQEMVLEKSSYEKMAVIIYQIYSYLEINNVESQILKVLVDSASSFYGYDSNHLMNFTLSLIREDNDALTMISNIGLSDQKRTSFSSIIISNTKRQLEERYDKNKISTRINNGGLCVGDDVFDNGTISVSRLITELDMLSEDNLKDYIGENKLTSFTIPENDIGYLKLKEKLPVCKVMTKENGFYTLVRYDDKSYLLFKISGDSKCYGISFPSDFGGGRKVVVFEIPTDYEYMMSLK